MNVTLNRINDDYLFEAKGANNIAVLIDNKTGDSVKGASPMELLLMAVGSCNAIDIISILKKQRQEITSYTIKVEGERKESKEARPFEYINVKIYLEGALSEEKVKRAAALSFEKYCSVSITLESSVEITYEIILNEKPI